MPHCTRLIVRAALVVSLAAAGCSGSEEPDGELDPDAPAGVNEGLSREQIESRARPMTPEQAEELGIIDTITHLESPAPQDTSLPPLPDSVLRRDTLP